MDLAQLHLEDASRRTPVRPADWAAAEAWLGLRYPGAFKAMLADHGPVLLGGVLEIETPRVRADGRDYATWLRDAKYACRQASRERPPHRPPAFHPAPGGLLPWAGSLNEGLWFCWDTSVSADPDRWTVTVCRQPRDRHGDQPVWRAYDLTLDAFLEAVLLDELPLPGRGVLGPLPLTVRHRSEPDDRPWTSPRPRGLTDAGRDSALRSGSGLAALELLAPPPAVPHLGDVRTWEDLTAELGTRLPADYLELMHTYGAGNWNDWLRLHTPLAAHGLLGHLRERTDAYRSKRESFPDRYPLAVWPEPGGFLPIATTYDNDALGWLTIGDPDRWPVVVEPRQTPQGEPLDGTLTEVLLAWTRGRLDAEGLPGIDPEDDPFDFAEFEPWTETAYW